MFCEKGLGPATLLKKRLWHRCFPVNFLKFLRTPFLANPTKKKLMTKCPLTKKHNTLTTQMHLHTTQIHRDERNKHNTSSITARKAIQEGSKPSINKISEHNSSIYYGNHLLFFNVFYLMLFLNFRLFISFFFTNISGYTNKKSQSIFYISHISFCYF